MSKPSSGRIVCAVAFLVSLLGACVGAEPQSAGIDPRREDMLAIAERYASYRWTPTAANVHHGADPDGVRVDTPDAGYRDYGFRVGELHTGIPYQWGGFSSLEQFDQGIRDGKYAGHLPARGTVGSSRHAVGVDCSGFVSRCWRLPRKHSTRSIGSICYELDDFGDLEPGDILNSFDGHVVLFESFSNAAKTRFDVYEAASRGVRKSSYSLAKLQKRGYKALRYKPLDARWVALSLGAATWTRPEAADLEFDGESTTPRHSLDRARAAFDAGRAGDWVSYAVSGGLTITRAVRMRSPAAVTLRTKRARGDKVQENEIVRARDRSLVRSLLDVSARDQKFDDIQMRDVEITTGQARVGARTFACRRIRVEVAATLLTRSVRYPVTIRVDALQSDAVPVSGILRAYFRYSLRRRNQKKPVEWGTVLRLRAFRRQG